jgi:hypothetical protein
LELAAYQKRSHARPAHADGGAEKPVSLVVVSDSSASILDRGLTTHGGIDGESQLAEIELF